VDPLKEKLPPRAPLAAKYRTAFNALMSAQKKQLDDIRVM